MLYPAPSYIMLSRLLAVGLLLFAVAFWHPSSNAEEASPPTDSQEISEDAFVVLVVKLGQSVLFDELFGYMHADSVLVPLGLIMEALEFPITIDIDTGQSEGWFLAENRRFALDLGRREAVVEGRRIALPDDLIAQVKDDDIFVDIRLLTEWFPLKLVFDQANLALNIDPTEPLPIQQRLAREEFRKKNKKRPTQALDYPHLNIPRSWFSWPRTDINLNTGLQPDDAGSWSAGFDYSATVAMSLLQLDSAWFFSGSKEEPFSSARARFSHPGFDDIGWLSGARLAFGDTSSISTPLVSSGKSGIGLAVSNIPLGIPQRFDQVDLEGDLTPGWEIELYHNGQLLDFRKIEEDGRYRFEGVDLLFGENIFRLVAYGPQGQRRERFERYNVGQSMVLPGELHYRLAAHQTDQSLLPFNPAQDAQAEPAMRYFAEAQWGATDWLTLTGRWNRLSLGTDAGSSEQDFFTLGGRSALLGGSIELDTTLSLANPENKKIGSATRLRLQRRLGDISAGLQYDHFDNFNSEVITSSSDPIRSSLTLALRGATDLSTLELGLAPLGWTLSSHTDRYASGTLQTQASLRTATTVRGISLSNNLEWSMDDDWPLIDQTKGSFLFSGKPYKGVRIRGALDYSVRPKAWLDTFSLNLAAKLPLDLSLNASASFDLFGDQEPKYTLGLNHNLRHSHFNLGINLDYEEELSLGMNLSFAFGKQHDQWKMSADSMTGQGAIVTRTFIDQDADGSYSEGDTLLENVRYMVNGSAHKTRSDAEGMALLSGLGLGRTTQISVELASLPDPFLTPTPPGVAIKASLGTVPTVDFPLISTGEIDGTVYLVRDGKLQPIKADLELVDAAGKPIQQTRSSYDGFYLFSYVPIGKYQIRVEPELASRLDSASIKPIDVQVKPGEEFLNGIDMLLKPIEVTKEKEKDESLAATS